MLYRAVLAGNQTRYSNLDAPIPKKHRAISAERSFKGYQATILQKPCEVLIAAVSVPISKATAIGWQYSTASLADDSRTPSRFKTSIIKDH